SIHDGKVGAPRPDGIAVLLRQHARDLRDVTEVVRRPGREQLPHGHGAEGRMLSLEGELFVRQTPTLERTDALRAQLLEFSEQRVERPPRAVAGLSEPVERLEGPTPTFLENHARARDPVGA